MTTKRTSPTRRFPPRPSRRARRRGPGAADILAAAAIVYTLGEAQHMVHASKARFRVLVAGRRFGKTVLAIIELLLFALTRGNANCWYVAPTKEMAEEIAWGTLKAMLKLLPARLVSSISESKLRIRFKNGSVIQLKSAHKRDSLRGRPLDFLVVDECAMLPLLLWEEVLAPMLADRQGSVLFISTPRGFNWFYDFYLGGLTGKGPEPANARDETDEQIAKALGTSVESISADALAAIAADRPDEWAAWQFTSLDGGRIPQHEIVRLRRRLDPRAFRQELLASFEALGGRVYDDFSRDAHPAGNVDATIVDREGDLFVGVDFNVNPMTAVIAQRGAAHDDLEVLDCLTIETSNTRELGEAVIRKYVPQGRAPSGRLLRTLLAHPDAAGKNRDTRSGTTDHAILAELGFIVDAPEANPLVVDRVGAVQAMVLDADGRRRLRVHPRATALIRAMEGQVWKTKERAPDKGEGLDHPNDALGYLVWRSFNLHAQLWGSTRVLY